MYVEEQARSVATRGVSFTGRSVWFGWGTPQGRRPARCDYVDGAHGLPCKAAHNHWLQVLLACRSGNAAIRSSASTLHGRLPKVLHVLAGSRCSAAWQARERSTLPDRRAALQVDDLIAVR